MRIVSLPSLDSWLDFVAASARYADSIEFATWLYRVHAPIKRQQPMSLTRGLSSLLLGDLYLETIEVRHALAGLLHSPKKKSEPVPTEIMEKSPNHNKPRQTMYIWSPHALTPPPPPQQPPRLGWLLGGGESMGGGGGPGAGRDHMYKSIYHNISWWTTHMWPHLGTGVSASQFWSSTFAYTVLEIKRMDMFRCWSTSHSTQAVLGSSLPLSSHIFPY